MHVGKNLHTAKHQLIVVATLPSGAAPRRRSVTTVSRLGAIPPPTPQPPAGDPEPPQSAGRPVYGSRQTPRVPNHYARMTGAIVDYTALSPVVITAQTKAVTTFYRTEGACGGGGRGSGVGTVKRLVYKLTVSL